MRAFATLTRRDDFFRLRQSGRRRGTAHFTIFRHASPPRDTRPLAGITVSGRIGGAVVRNRLRRRIAAALHELLRGSTPSRLLIVPRPEAAALSYAAIVAELRSALS